MRKQSTLILVKQNERLKIHFVDHDVLTGSNNNIWFPIQSEETLFVELDDIMTDCKVARNLVSLQVTKSIETEMGFSKDYKLEYDTYEMNFFNQ